MTPGLIAAVAYGTLCVAVALVMRLCTRADINMEGDPANRMPDELTGYGQSDGLGRQVHGVAVHTHSATAKEARHHG